MVNTKKKRKPVYCSVSRILTWVFSKSGSIPLAIEHFLAMLPATILVPLLINNTCGNVMDVSLVLFTSGLGTITFCFFSALRFDTDKKRFYFDKPLPAYLGSSFAYIAITIYLLDTQMLQGTDGRMAFVYVGWAYIFSSLVLIVLSTLFYFVKGIDRIFSKYLPASVIGPAISLIGLELSGTAVADAGFKTDGTPIDYRAIIVSLTTLCVIIIFSLFKRNFLKNAAIIVGMVVGCVVYFYLYGMPQADFTRILDISVPEFKLILLTPPKNWGWLFLSVIPATLVVFTESIGRVTVISRMVNENSDSKVFDPKSMKTMGRAVFSHGLTIFTSASLGSIPNTIYAEYIAVMGIHKDSKIKHDPCEVINKITNPYSAFPYLIAALIAILFSFSDVLQAIVLNIPKPVIGGMELFLFGIISAPGIQLLVEQRVNYKKTSNQIITAAVLLTGLSELSVSFAWFEIKGMSLGLIAGFVLNVIVIILKRFGVLCDPITMDEAVSCCLLGIPKKYKDSCTFDIAGNREQHEYPNIGTMISYLEGYGDDDTSELWRDIIVRTSEFKLYNGEKELLVNVVMHENSLTVNIPTRKLDSEFIIACLNDHRYATDIDWRQNGDSIEKTEMLVIDLSRNVPLRMLEQLVKYLKYEHGADTTSDNDFEAKS